MSEILYWSASQIAAAIKDRKISSSEAVEACLERIDEVNPKINAVVQIVAERARSEAGHRDQQAAKGEFAGPLHGVPVTLKDSIETEGIVSTGGTMGRKHFVPDRDAPVAQRLRKAGAVLLGKTNTPELTFSGETHNLIYGRTCNPYDPERSPGGSSGGSAAVVAAGGAALDLGSDTGGSIREPAHFTGIAGIKPTSGRTPRTGHIVPFGGILDSLTQIGPMARYVEDLELSLPIICGPDGEDPFVMPVAMGDPGAVDVSRLRIAFYNHNGVVAPCGDIMRVAAHVASELEQKGLNIQEQLLPDMAHLVSLSTRLREAANAGFILRLLEKCHTGEPGPGLHGYLTEAGLEDADKFTPVLIEQIDNAKSRALQFMSNFDAIICPPSRTVARPHGASYDDSFNDWSYVTVYNLLGWPAATVRAGTSEENGLPVGVQVVAAPWREDIVLALLKEIESIGGGYQRPEI